MKTSYRKFPKIYRLEKEEQNNKKAKIPSLVENIRAGKDFNITEKLDGANACLEIIKHGDNFEYAVYSHNHQLDNKNTLRGWYEYAINSVLPKLKPLENTPNDFHYYLYGEWLVSHTVNYKDDKYHKWYLFSVYDAINDHEFSLSERSVFANKYELDTPKILFSGSKSDITLEFLTDFVGKSDMTKEIDKGEGIIVESNGIRAKIVADRFKEVQKIKKPKPELSLYAKFVEETLTQARFDKMVGKLKDENKMPEFIDFEHFRQLANALNQPLWLDIMEEEKDNLPEPLDEKALRKCFNKKLPIFIRNLIKQIEEDDLDF